MEEYPSNQNRDKPLPHNDGMDSETCLILPLMEQGKRDPWLYLYVLNPPVLYCRVAFMVWSLNVMTPSARVGTSEVPLFPQGISISLLAFWYSYTRALRGFPCFCTLRSTLWGPTDLPQSTYVDIAHIALSSCYSLMPSWWSHTQSFCWRLEA